MPLPTYSPCIKLGELNLNDHYLYVTVKKARSGLLTEITFEKVLVGMTLRENKNIF